MEKGRKFTPVTASPTQLTYLFGCQGLLEFNLFAPDFSSPGGYDFQDKAGCQLALFIQHLKKKPKILILIH